MSENLDQFVCESCGEIKYGDECARDFNQCKDCMNENIILETYNEKGEKNEIC